MASEYEQTRVANIKRNEDFLKNIGLHDLQQSMRGTVSPESKPRSSSNPRPRSRKRSRVEGTKGDLDSRVPSTARRSRRLRQSTSSSKTEEGEGGGAVSTVEETFLYLKDGQAVAKEVRSGWQHRQEQRARGEDENEEAVPERIRPQQLLDYIMAADEDHFDQADTAGVSLCCERINSMSGAGLRLRLQRIKQTNKMILFYYGLALAGMARLAAAAKEKLAKNHKVIIR